jgi:hypothetical protein
MIPGKVIKELGTYYLCAIWFWLFSNHFLKSNGRQFLLFNCIDRLITVEASVTKDSNSHQCNTHDCSNSNYRNLYHFHWSRKWIQVSPNFMSEHLSICSMNTLIVTYSVVGIYIAFQMIVLARIIAYFTKGFKKANVEGIFQSRFYIDVPSQRILQFGCRLLASCLYSATLWSFYDCKPSVAIHCFRFIMSCNIHRSSIIKIFVNVSTHQPNLKFRVVRASDCITTWCFWVTDIWVGMPLWTGYLTIMITSFIVGLGLVLMFIFVKNTHLLQDEVNPLLINKDP